MKKIVCLFLSLLSLLAVQAAVITYVPDNTTVFRNPERGFTEEMSRKVSVNKPNVVKGNLSSTWGVRYNMTLAVVLYNFNYFKAQDLPDQVLAGFDEDMQELRNYGLKCVLRFAYTESESDKVDATPDWVERHLQQLAPHLESNKDVIYVVEAGFVGVWGEWYYTTNYGNETQHLNPNRRRVVDALMLRVPADRFVLFRYPTTKFDYFGSEEPLPADSAFTGTTRARMGYHNDAFLHNWGNMGTYASDDLDDDPAVRQFIATETLYTPNGGETNIDDDNALAESRYTLAPSEMATYHWSFCGSSYATPVTSRWRNSGLFDTLNVHMGYRYNLIDAQLSDSAAPGGKANVTIRLRNDGYAPIYNERHVFLTLKNGNTSYSLPLTADPRRWLPNGFVSAINEQLDIPASVPEGTYHLYLYLPDISEQIMNDPRYAVRLANQGVWDAETGLNDLGATLVVNASAPLNPGELPSVETALKSTPSASSKVRKVLENGAVSILLPDGRKYNVLGQCLN